MDDLISRKVTIDTLYADDEKDWTFDDDTKQITFVVPISVYNEAQTIFISPGYEGKTGLRGKVFSEQPERKIGKWIEEERGIHTTKYRCSVCGRVVWDDTGYDITTDYPYCNCGAKMEGAKNERTD